MAAAAGPLPTGHACGECALRFRTAGQLSEHVTSDHRPAADGAELIRALLTAPSRVPPGAAARPRPYRPLRERFSRSAVLRSGVALVLLLWVLSTTGASWPTLAVVGAAVVVVSAAATALAWLDEAAPVPGPHRPSGPGAG